MTALITTLNELAWGPLMLALLLGTGIFLSMGLRFMPVRKIPTGLKLLLHGRKGSGDGDISPFSALMTSLSATIGTGNIAGVATAIALGGPGALFWMWITALVGLATKYAEAVCAVRFRETDANGASKMDSTGAGTGSPSRLRSLEVLPVLASPIRCSQMPFPRSCRIPFLFLR